MEKDTKNQENTNNEKEFISIYDFKSSTLQSVHHPRYKRQREEQQ